MLYNLFWTTKASEEQLAYAYAVGYQEMRTSIHVRKQDFFVPKWMIAFKKRWLPGIPNFFFCLFLPRKSVLSYKGNPSLQHIHCINIIFIVFVLYILVFWLTLTFFLFTTFFSGRDRDSNSQPLLDGVNQFSLFCYLPKTSFQKVILKYLKK